MKLSNKFIRHLELREHEVGRTSDVYVEYWFNKQDDLTKKKLIDNFRKELELELLSLDNLEKHHELNMIPLPDEQ